MMREGHPSPGSRELGAKWEKKALRRVLSCVGLGLLAFLAGGVAIAQGMAALRHNLALAGGAIPFEASQLLDLLAYAASMLLPLPVIVWLLGRPLRSLVPMTSPRPGFLFPALGLTMGLSMGANYLSAIAVNLVQEAIGRPLPSFSPKFGGGILSVALTIAATALAPAILEELLFRGVILHSLRPFGDGFAVAVSAAVFALCHTTIGQWIPAFAAGLCLGTFVVRSGSVLTGMAIHFFYNLLVTLVAMGGFFGDERQQAILSLGLVALSLAAAMVSYLLLSGRHGAIFAMSPADTLLTGGQRAGAILTSIPLVTASGLLLFFTLWSAARGAGV